MKTVDFLCSFLLVVGLLAGAPLFAEGNEIASPDATNEVQSAEPSCVTNVNTDDLALAELSQLDEASKAKQSSQGLTCEEQCEAEYYECMSGCWVGDFECREDCGYDYSSCLWSC